jgi:dienelactone hydrolase
VARNVVPPRRRGALAAALAATALAWAGMAGATALNAGLNEEVVRLRLHGTLYELETTLFKPAGPGPFPLLVVNHGKGADNVAIALDRGRVRYPTVAHEFVKRGWLVAVPMRRGFANSDGVLPRPSCDVAGYARREAEDVAGAVNALAARRDVDPARIVVMGNSAGGMAAVAYAAAPRPGVQAVVSFAGGLRLGGDTSSRCWPAVLNDAFRTFARADGPPQLWVYAENDRVFPPAVVRDAFDAFRSAGGRAELLVLPALGTDGHDVMTNPEGRERWLPEVLGFLGGLRLPVKPFAGSGFAAVDQVEAMPAPPACRRQYERYLAERAPKAYALSRSGRTCSWAARDERAAEKALENCRKGAPDCALYAYDDIVVWTEL